MLVPIHGLRVPPPVGPVNGLVKVPLVPVPVPVPVIVMKVLRVIPVKVPVPVPVFVPVPVPVLVPVLSVPVLSVPVLSVPVLSVPVLSVPVLSVPVSVPSLTKDARPAKDYVQQGIIETEDIFLFEGGSDHSKDDLLGPVFDHSTTKIANEIEA